MVYIYEIIDPVSQQTVYVGKTKRSLNTRLWYHVYDAKKDTKNIRFFNWIKSLLRKDLYPIILKIDEVPEQDWQFWERHYISLYRSWGFDLKNCTDGGDGNMGFTKEVREKISIGNKKPKHSHEWRKSQSAKNSGSGNPFFGKRHSVSTKEKMREAKKKETERPWKQVSVRRVDSFGNQIVYSSIKEACLKNYLKNHSGIVKACLGQRTSAYGFNWQYV